MIRSDLNDRLVQALGAELSAGSSFGAAKSTRVDLGRNLLDHLASSLRYYFWLVFVYACVAS